jgi:protein-tyrosine phosphatase
MKKISVLFICLGNICRSPTAEGVFRHLVDAAGLQNSIEIDSAGTHAYHVGEAPDWRSQEAALGRGIDMSKQKARAVCDEDFERFDYLLAMDESNLSALQRRKPSGSRSQVQLFLSYAPKMGASEVPDPYYGGESGFEHVLDLVQAAAAGLLGHIRRHDL